MPIAVVKQSAKVHGPLVLNVAHYQDKQQPVLPRGSQCPDNVCVGSDENSRRNGVLNPPPPTYSCVNKQIKVP